MEFLLTTQGLLYNGPALILLAYLILSRPLTGAVVALLAAVRVFAPPSALATGSRLAST